jgi:hypothetical protein
VENPQNGGILLVVSITAAHGFQGGEFELGSQIE